MKTLVPFAKIQQAPTVGPDWPVDGDGILIPPDVAHNWHRFSKPMRVKTSQTRLEWWQKEQDESTKPPKTPGAKATNFTTGAAIKWGRRQGWKLIERERYNHFTKRHHDCELGTDAIFDDGLFGRVGIQGAGKGERASHYQRFTERGGVDTAKRRALRVLYLEFERGNPEPTKQEWWS